MAARDDLASLYATKVVELLESEEERRDVVDAELLRTIAKDLGMTDEQLAAAVEQAEALLVEAKRMREHGLVEESVVALERAWALAPMRPDVRLALGDALFARWRRRKRPNDLAQAKAFVRATVDLQPTNAEALSLLQRIHNEEKLAAASNAPVIGVIVGVVMALVVGALAILRALF